MTLISHCGARAVTWGKLDELTTPPATATWFPLPHGQVLGSVVQTLDNAGFRIESMELAVTSDDARFFGTLQLQALIAPASGWRSAFATASTSRCRSGSAAASTSSSATTSPSAPML